VQIVWFALIFYAGGVVGFLLRWWLESRRNYSGTIYVTHEDKKTLYSLELEDYPEKLVFEKEVVFKVDTSKIDTSKIFAPEKGLSRN
jgi:hypothetical protein